MLDFVLDYFVKYLVKGITPEKTNQGAIVDFNQDSVDHIIQKKKYMIEIMSELIHLIPLESSSLRQFDDGRFIDSIIQLITFISANQLSSLTTTADYDRQIRICLEIYMSKLRNMEQLLDILDKTFPII
jgi:hypothetical protein